MSVSENEFKLAMGSFPSGVTIVTTIKDESNYGITISSFSSLSLSPKLVSFAIDKKSSSHDIFYNSQVVGVNILSKTQKDLSVHFSKKNNDFSNIDLIINKVPLINGCTTNLTCRIVNKHPAGDHTLFFAEVENINNNSKEPLIYKNGNYI